MRSRQKRALFQREFGAGLLPRGFVYRENMFLRLHPGEVLLAVGLYLSPSGSGYIEYGVLPFCNGISRPPFSGLARVSVRNGRRWEDIFHAREQAGHGGTERATGAAMAGEPLCAQRGGCARDGGAFLSERVL